MSFGVIFGNIIGFDGLIFIAAAVNVLLFRLARSSALKLYESMHKQVYAPSCAEDIAEIKEDISELSDKKVSAMREAAVGRYTLFVNVTGIFPLLGILGTVISLLGMVGTSQSVESGFFAALTSTFWGLIFAITFKFLDSFISPKLDDAERAAELYMQRRASGDCRTDMDSLNKTDTQSTLPEVEEYEVSR